MPAQQSAPNLPSCPFRKHSEAPSILLGWGPSPTAEHLMPSLLIKPQRGSGSSGKGFSHSCILTVSTVETTKAEWATRTGFIFKPISIFTCWKRKGKSMNVSTDLSWPKVTLKPQPPQDPQEHSNQKAAISFRMIYYLV